MITHLNDNTYCHIEMLLQRSEGDSYTFKTSQFIIEPFSSASQLTTTFFLVFFKSLINIYLLVRLVSKIKKKRYEY